MQLTIEQTVAISEDAVFREIEGESVVLNLESGMYYGLDEVGTLVWHAVEPRGTLRTAVERVVAEFDTDASTAEQDVLELAAGLVDKGLWTVV